MQKKSQLTIVIKDKTGNNVELSVDKAKIDRMRLEQERLANEIKNSPLGEILGFTKQK